MLKIIWRGLTGAVTGLVYYFLYATALPVAFQHIAGLPVSVEAPMDFSTILAIFIALGVAENVAPAIPGSLFKVLSKLVGASYLYFITNGGVVSANISNYIVTLDMSPLIYIILAGSLIVGVLDATTYVYKGSLGE